MGKNKKVTLSLVLLGSVWFLYMMLGNKQPRGLRNNNPGNIKVNPQNDWKGSVGADLPFEIFAAPEWGIRAIGKTLDSYNRRGIDTIHEIITTYAPASDNNKTDSYIAAVSQQMGVDSRAVLGQGDRVDLVAAIITHENGYNPYSGSFISASLSIG